MKAGWITRLVLHVWNLLLKQLEAQMGQLLVFKMRVGQKPLPRLQVLEPLQYQLIAFGTLNFGGCCLALHANSSISLFLLSSREDVLRAMSTPQGQCGLFPDLFVTMRSRVNH